MDGYGQNYIPLPMVGDNYNTIPLLTFVVADMKFCCTVNFILTDKSFQSTLELCILNILL